MTDYMVRATAEDGYVRAFAVTTKGVTEYARKVHDLSPVGSAALGRTMAGALMMGAMMKGDTDLLTIQFEGDGPIGGITVTADAKGNVKGYVGNPSVILPPNQYGKLDVGGAVGKGVLRVMKDIGLKEPYSGEVAIQNGEIAQDLTYYFAASEQVPSVVALGVLVNREDYSIRESGGYIIQLMPNCPEDVISRLEDRCARCASVTELLRAGETPETILQKILGDMDLRIFGESPVRFHCNCSRERVSKVLLAMGEKNLNELIAEGKPVTLNCHFCNTDYTFTVPEIEAIRDSGRTAR